MKYMGSKNRISSYIIPFFEEISSKRGIENYYEPFVGGANMIDKISSSVSTSIFGSDNNIFLIEMFKKLKDGWIPPTDISKEVYSMNRSKFNSGEYSHEEIAEIGFIGFICSYGGRFYDGGYANISGNRNYQEEAYRNIMKQIPNLRNVEFSCSQYWDLEILPNSIIYCDIPYKGTKEYSIDVFDHERFYAWARLKSSEGHEVFVSEYFMPPDFKEIWKKEVKSNLHKNKTTKSVEKLFYMGDYILTKLR